MVSLDYLLSDHNLESDTTNDAYNVPRSLRVIFRGIH